MLALPTTAVDIVITKHSYLFDPGSDTVDKMPQNFVAALTTRYPATAGRERHPQVPNPVVRGSRALASSSGVVMESRMRKARVSGGLAFGRSPGYTGHSGGSSISATCSRSSRIRSCQ